MHPSGCASACPRTPAPCSGSTRRSPIAEPVALLALATDAAIGWPEWLYARVGHPVGGFARLIHACERRWNRPHHSQRRRRLAGVATIALPIAIGAGGAWAAEVLLRHLLGPYAWIGVALLAAPGLAQRSLDDHVRPIAAALAEGNLPAARPAVARIVGRDTAALDEPGVARAAIESLSESFCDGVAAPLFWLLLLGLPGLWAYKAINTADSLIGHREERWRAFGWASARIDDCANLVPARLGGAVLCLAGGGGWRTMRRDAHRHASPNAGWTEAAMAGVLRVRLAGPVAYDGVVSDKPWIGGSFRDPDARDLGRALRVYRRACLFLWILAGAFAWLL
ncbi:adenosylcobinamide-phosphate synthase CbiB [Sphingomonas sp. PL-96]|uniref:adenosylcobinamide-phosphate synthase CbiB n=1 Tax=Sphingomonas sp. PL-96 TaxID=2887201 RepID=UPI001E632D9C|nr:adenosylcobinamide-phosphate synthase CbiB [Sphingomonas sp. PL-96]MCC2975900.1 adenosylcobinamide-phosphate synthase CbiB [Sphingomonas sp. PL-96]